MYFDSHCHLLKEFYGERLDSVAKEVKEDKTTALNNAVNLETSLEVLDTFKKFKWLLPAVGVSPYDAVKNPGEVQAVVELAEDNKDSIYGIGEIGLDLHHFQKGPDFDCQKKVFAEMLKLAEKLDKPAVIHSRKAEAEVFEMLPSFSCKKVMHCFLKEKLVRRALDLGCVISVPTLKSKDRVRILKETPLEVLVFETDSPYLWNGENKPGNVKSVYENAAEARGITVDEVVEKVGLNAERLGWMP